MITPINKTKHSITPSAVLKSGYALWNDSAVTWDSSSYFWDSPVNSITNKAKHSISPNNKDKS